MADPATSEALRRALTEATSVKCPRCKYDLAKLVGDRCPECGANVERALRLASFGPRRRIIYLRDVRDAILVIVGPTLLLALTVGFWWILQTTRPPAVVELGVALVLTLMVASAAGVWWRTLRLLSGWAFPTRLAASMLLWGPGLAGAGLFAAYAP